MDVIVQNSFFIDNEAEFKGAAMTYGEKEIQTVNVTFENNVAKGIENQDVFKPTRIALLIPKNFTDFVILE